MTSRPRWVFGFHWSPVAVLGSVNTSVMVSVLLSLGVVWVSGRGLRRDLVEMGAAVVSVGELTECFGGYLWH